MTTSTPTTDQTAVQLLEGALTYIRTHGWQRGRVGYKNPGDTCPASVRGALRAAVGYYEGMPDEDLPQSHWQAREALDNAMPEIDDEDGIHVTDVEEYNDLYAADQEEIENLFLQAIEYARAEFEADAAA